MKKPKASQADVLDLRQELFVEAYVTNGSNGTAAYHSAYPEVSRDSARTLASKLLTNICIRDAIEKKREELTSAISFKRDQYIRILVAQATMNPHFLRRKVAEGIPLTYEEGFAIDCKASDRKAALDSLAIIFGFTVERDKDGRDSFNSGVADAIQRIIGGRKK